MVDIIDSTQSFTINLIAPPPPPPPPPSQGFGQIVAGSLQAPTELAAGEPVNISISVRNDGQVADNLVVYVQDPDALTNLYFITGYVGVGQTMIVRTSGIVMPNRNLNILIQAGHIE